MRFKSSLLASTFAAATLWLCASPEALASTYHVSPTRVDLGGIYRSAILTIRNESSEDAVVIQTRMFSWTQRDGDDITTPNTDLIVNPPIFTLKPGGQQVIRIGPRDARLLSASPIEATYRLLLAEVPQAPEQGNQRIAVALNLSIPIFFSPNAVKLDDASPKIRLSRNANDNIFAHVANTGGKSIKISSIKLVDRTTRAMITETDGFRYVLAGSTISWPLKPYPAPISNVAFTVTSERGTQDIEIDDADSADRQRQTDPANTGSASPRH